MLVYYEFAKYGVQTTFYFALEDITDAEAPFTGVAPLVGDIWLSRDGGAAANATNAFVAISNGIYSWVATAAEMAATRLAVSVYDATGAAIFKPIYVVILTKLQIVQIDADATAIGGNVSGILATGGGTGRLGPSTATTAPSGSRSPPPTRTPPSTPSASTAAASTASASPSPNAPSSPSASPPRRRRAPGSRPPDEH